MVANRQSRPRPRSLTADADDDARALHEAAIRLLTRREHAAAELAAKLEQRGFERAAAEEQVAELARAGLQSDQRFAEGYVAERMERGDGPVKIRGGLEARGLAREAVDTALEGLEVDWIERAREVARQRFGEEAPTSWRERARRARFLEQRGFPADVVRRVTQFDETAAGDN